MDIDGLKVVRLAVHDVGWPGDFNYEFPVDFDYFAVSPAGDSLGLVTINYGNAFDPSSYLILGVNANLILPRNNPFICFRFYNQDVDPTGIQKVNIVMFRGYPLIQMQSGQ